MIITVKNSAPFQILTSAMVIGPSQTGYQLEVAADGRNFSPLFSVGPNVTRQATNLSSGAYYRLNGNVGEVKVNWNRSCVTEGGSGSGTELAPVEEFPLGAAEGTVVAYNGTASASGVYQYTGEEWVPVGVDDLSAYWTSAQTKDYVDSAISAISLDKLVAVNELPTSAETGTVMALYQEGEAGGGTWVYDETEDKWVFECDFSTLDTGETYNLGHPLYYDFFCVEFENVTLFYSNGGWYAGCVFADRVDEECGEPYQHTILLSASTPETTWNDERDNCGDEETYYNTKFGWDPTDQKLKCWAEGYDTSLCGPFTPEVNNISGGTPTSILGLYQYDGQNWNEIGGVDTEEIELPIAAAVNELKGNFEARLNQQYYKKAEVDGIAARKVEAGQVDAQIKDYVDPAIAEVNDTIEDKELPVSAALNKLNEDIATIDEVIPAAIVDINDRMVSSSTVKTIWRGSQNEYDAITVKDAATLYIII